jgi:RNA polymerase sigma-70 factor, ECF subfamily
VARVASFAAGAAEQRGVIAPWNEERRLLAALRAGDRAAADALVERTYEAVYASLYRMCGDRDTAADLTQETYQKAWSALSSFDGRSQFFTWLYRIAYTTFLNHVRRPHRVSPLDEYEAAALPDKAPPADQVLAENEQAAALRKVVLDLPEDLRFTVTAHFWGGLAVKEIAEIEGITTVAIRKRLAKAYSILESLLDEDVR